MPPKPSPKLTEPQRALPAVTGNALKSVSNFASHGDGDIKYQTVKALVAEGVLWFDPKAGRITETNRTLREMLGYGDQEISDLTLAELTRTVGESSDEKQISGNFDPAPYFDARKFVHKNGLVLELEVKSRRVRVAGKWFWCVVCREAARDIGMGREKLRWQYKLQQAQKMESIATLAGGIAHQFNNALYAITGNISLLEGEFPQQEGIARYTKRMIRSTDRMTRLTNQLLAYARGGKYEARVISLSAFIRGTLPLVQHSIDPEIYIDTDLPRDIWHVKADLTQMQMVLTAVLQNAAEAIEDEGRINVSARNRLIETTETRDGSDLHPGRYVRASIVDDGKGMDAKTRARIFEPFFTTKFQGRGLGMAAVYGIIKNHGGWIFLESEPSKGTRVDIYLPAVEVPEVNESKPDSREFRAAGTILLIDDDEMVMEVSQSILTKMGYEILLATTGRQAVEHARGHQGKIDLAILDIVLPDMDGTAVYPQLVKYRPGLKVVVCSGYSIDGPAQDILDAGADGFIQKPFSFGELSSVLKDALNGD